MDRAQRLYEKSGLVVMLTPKVMVFEMSKMTNYLYFLLMTSKN